MLDRHRQSLISPKSQLFDPCRVLLLYLLVQCHFRFATVRAEANVTVDDGDSRITYSPPGAWRKSEQTELNYGGSHMLTQNPNATAIFNFTGTAVYFLSPLWPYKVNTAISLDSSPPSLIDLIDHSKPDTSQGSETVQSNVVWSASRLSNTQHIVRVSVGAGESYGIVDAFRYTDPSASTSTASRVVANPSFATSAQPSRSKSAVPIALGVLFGLVGAAIIFVGIWYLWRRRKRRPASQAWTVDGSAYAAANGSGHGVIPGAGGFGNGYGYGPPSAYGYESQGQPIPYPPFTYGNYAAPPAPGVPYPNVPPNRAPNRYQPGYTLSTITEKSTPQMADGTRTMPGTPMSGAVGGTTLGPHSPASIQSELGYYTAGSSVGQHSPAVVPGQHPELQPQAQHQQQHRTMGITSQMQMQGPGASYRK